jgi:hypothetical protein
MEMFLLWEQQNLSVYYLCACYHTFDANMGAKYSIV